MVRVFKQLLNHFLQILIKQKQWQTSLLTFREKIFQVTCVTSQLAHIFSLTMQEMFFQIWRHLWTVFETCAWLWGHLTINSSIKKLMHSTSPFKDRYVVEIQTSGSWLCSERRTDSLWIAKALSARFFCVSRPRARAPSSYSSEVLSWGWKYMLVKHTKL